MCVCLAWSGLVHTKLPVRGWHHLPPSQPYIEDNWALLQGSCDLSAFFLSLLLHSTFPVLVVLHSLISSANLASQCCLLPEVSKVRIVSDTEVSRHLPSVLVRIPDFWQCTVHTCPNTTRDAYDAAVYYLCTLPKPETSSPILRPTFWSTTASCKWMPWAKGDANWPAPEKCTPKQAHRQKWNYMSSIRMIPTHEDIQCLIHHSLLLSQPPSFLLVHNLWPPWSLESEEMEPEPTCLIGLHLSKQQ